MSDKKQTVVQWFKDVLYPYLDKESKEYVDILFNYALKIEREQIIDAFSEGTKMIDINNELGARFNACVYYVETYGGQDE
jgi:hypothetical protein